MNYIKRLISMVLITLMVFTILPANVSATTSKEPNHSSPRGMTESTSNPKALDAGEEIENPIRTELLSFGFESQTEADEWTCIDADGDGNNWQWAQNSDKAYEGNGLMFSESYINYVGALTPDNWLISPPIELGEDNYAVSMYLNGWDASWVGEHFAVYAGMSADTADMVQILPDTVVTADYMEYMAVFPQFESNIVYIAIRHFNSTDMYRLDLDNVSVFEVPEEVTVTFVDGVTDETLKEKTFPFGTILDEPDFPETPEHEGHTFVTWDYNGQAIIVDTTIIAHYAEVHDGTNCFFGFESQEEADKWTCIDADGDGNNWYWITGMHTYEGSGIMTSDSYINDSGPLTPDNWLISPRIRLGDELPAVSMFIRAQDADWYSEHFAVYAGTSTDISDMVEVLHETIITGEYLRYDVDLSQFAGQTVFIAIRHFSCTDMFRINVDAISFFDAEEEVTVTFTDGVTGETISEVNVPAGTELDEEFFPESPEHYGFAFQRWGHNSQTVMKDITVTAYYAVMYYADNCIFEFANETEVNHWTRIDADGDGYNWLWDDTYMSSDSMSWDGSTALTPDNWLVSPPITIEDGLYELYMYLKTNQGEEHFAVYAGTSANPNEMVEVIPESVATDEYQRFATMLAYNSGDVIFIAIRHFDSTSQSYGQKRIVVDSVGMIDKSHVTVSFVNYNGTVLQSESVAYGETPVYAGEPPAKPADAQYTYEFAGWDPEIVTATDETVYTATYTPVLRSYTVIFVNADGTVLQSGEVFYGETPAYEGEMPEKPANEQYTYEFAGWDNEFSPVTGETTYTATYTPVLRSYTITFINYDGEVLQSGEVAYGETPVYNGETPEMPADEHCSYIFADWDPEIAAVTGEATYTATFVPEHTMYTITFTVDGEEYASQTFEVGAEVTAPEYVVPEGYSFSGWTLPETMPAEDITLDATLTANTYTVTFMVNGDIYEVCEFVYNTVITAPEYTVPAGHTFSGWDIPHLMPAENLTADAELVINTYNVVFLDWDDMVLSEQTVEYGHSASAPQAPEREGCRFTGWDSEFTFVTSDLTVRATYVRTFTVTFIGIEDSVLSVQTVDEGQPAIAPEIPEVDGYDFIEWDESFAEIYADTEIHAVYAKRCLVSYNANGGLEPVPEACYYHSGDSVSVSFAVIPGHENENAVFLGWSASSDAQQPDYPYGQSSVIIIGEADVVLYAVWHIHEYVVVETVEATCETDGYTMLVCSCGDVVYTDRVDAYGHDYSEEWTVDVEATCTEKGEKSHHCSRCDSRADITVIEALGHDFGEWIVDSEPTVVAEGHMHRDCSRCDCTEAETIDRIVIDIDENSDYGIANIIVKDSVTLEPIPNACLFISTITDGESTFYTDGNGELSITIPVGRHTISVYAQDYLVRTVNVNIYNMVNDLPAIGISKSQLVGGEVTVTEMTYEEMIEAGIDVDDPDNQHVFMYEATLSFNAGIDWESIIYYVNSNGSVVSSGGSGNLPIYYYNGPHYYSGGNGGVGGHEHEEGFFVIPVAENFFLVFHGEVKWIKEMFDVELLVVNFSNTDTIENCTAELIIPEGLSLAEMNGYVQELVQTIDYIGEGESVSKHWYIRGDEPGFYDVAVRLNGTMMPFGDTFEYLFTAQDPIKVYAADALHLTFEIPDSAFHGEDYTVRVILENVSDKPIYGVSHAILDVSQTQITYYSDGTQETTHIETHDGEAVSVPCFMPGDKLIIEISSNIIFDSELMKYKLQMLGSTVTSAMELMDAVDMYGRLFDTVFGGIDSLISDYQSFVSWYNNPIELPVGVNQNEVYSYLTEINNALGRIIPYMNRSDGNKLKVVGLLGAQIAEFGSLTDCLNNMEDYADFYEALSTVDLVSIRDTFVCAAELIRRDGDAPAFNKYEAVETAISIIPIRYYLEDVVISTLEGSTAEIPYSININHVGPRYFGVQNVGRYVVDLIKACFGKVDVSGSLLIFGAPSDPTGYNDAVEYITAVNNEATEIAARDTTGVTVFTAWVDINEDNPRRDISESDYLLTVAGNDSCTVNDGVLTFIGEGLIELTPLAIISGVLHVRMQNGSIEFEKEFHFTTEEKHECNPDNREIVIPANESSYGIVAYTCDVCCQIVMFEEVPLCEEHCFGEWEVLSEATTEEVGIMVKTCTHCGYYDIYVTEALPRSYVITYTINSELYTTQTYNFGDVVIAPEYDVPEGHTFSGWTVPATMPAEDLTINATLTVNEYTITYTINGEEYTTQTYEYGAAITAPEYDVPEGHTFSGWTVPDTMPYEDITVDAQLAPIPAIEPIVAYERMELRDRVNEDDKMDVRLIFKAQMNGAKIVLNYSNGDSFTYGNTESDCEITALNVMLKLEGHSEVNVDIKKLFDISNDEIMFTVCITDMEKTADWDLSVQPVITYTGGSYAPDSIIVKINYNTVCNN